VADRLGFACWDQELLTRIAEKPGAIESILASADERVHSPMMEFARSLLVGFEYTQNEYRIVLTKVVGAIAHQGAAVVPPAAARLRFSTASIGRSYHWTSAPRHRQYRLARPNGTATAAVDNDELSTLCQSRAAAGTKNNYGRTRRVIHGPGGIAWIKPFTGTSVGLLFSIVARVWNDHHPEFVSSRILGQVGHCEPAVAKRLGIKV